MINEKLDVFVTEIKERDVRATRSPYWLVIDPENLIKKKDAFCECGCHGIYYDEFHFSSLGIHGVFMSQEEAVQYMEIEKYTLSKESFIICASGKPGTVYDQMCQEVRHGL